MTLADDLELIAEHIGDDQPNLPEGAKNTLLLAAKALREYEADTIETLWDAYWRTHYKHDHHPGWLRDNASSDARWCVAELLKRGLIEKHPGNDFLSRPIAASQSTKDKV